MGHSTAAGFAEAVSDGLTSLRTALGYHLTVNHYPPHPAFMVEVALAAVTAADDLNWNESIPLPEGVSFRGRDEISAAEAVESLHLDAFLGATMVEED